MVTHRKTHLGIIALALLVATGAHAKTDAPAPSDAPPVLLLDTAPIWARYVDPKADNEAAAVRKTDLLTEMQPILRRYASQAGAEFVIDKAAMLFAPQTTQIDPRAIMLEMDKTDPPVDPAAPLPAALETVPVARNSSFVVVNRNAAAGLLRNDALSDVGVAINSALPQLVSDTKVNFILDRTAVVLGQGDIDATRDVVEAVRTGRTTRPKGHIFSARFLTLDRSEILQKSRAGNAIKAQIDDMAGAAEVEFRSRGEELKASGEALRAALPGMDPEEKQKQVAAFELREQALQSEVEARRKEITDAALGGRSSIEVVLGPIVKMLMEKRGITAVLDRTVVLFQPEGTDITADCIVALDNQLPSVAIHIASAPPKPPKGVSP